MLVLIPASVGGLEAVSFNETNVSVSMPGVSCLKFVRGDPKAGGELKDV